MNSRPPNVDEKKFMDEICQIGCIVCSNNGAFTPQVTPHHIDGRVKPNAHFNVIPLCGRHHQIADTSKPKTWYSRHGDGRRKFEDAYGTESELRDTCLGLMGDKWC